MSIDLNELKGQLIGAVGDAAKQANIEQQLSELAGNAADFVSASLPAIARYSELLLSKQITQDEFVSLMAGVGDLAEINGLTVAGLTAIQVDHVKKTIVNSVTTIVSGFVSKLAGGI